MRSTLFENVFDEMEDELSLTGIESNDFDYAFHFNVTTSILNRSKSDDFMKMLREYYYKLDFILEQLFINHQFVIYAKNRKLDFELV